LAEVLLLFLNSQVLELKNNAGAVLSSGCSSIGATLSRTNYLYYSLAFSSCVSRFFKERGICTLLIPSFLLQSPSMFHVVQTSW